MSMRQTQDTEGLRLGWNGSYNLYQDAKHLSFVWARYQCAFVFLSGCRRILELGCHEAPGLGWLARGRQTYRGVDLDVEAIDAAREHWQDVPGVSFCSGDFLGQRWGEFDGLLAIDVIEHIVPAEEARFWQTVRSNLAPDGLCVIGTPNLTAERFASEASRRGHVNLFDEKRLRTTMADHFRRVLSFGLNDEVFHAGFPAMRHYLLMVGCGVKE